MQKDDSNKEQKANAPENKPAENPSQTETGASDSVQEAKESVNKNPKKKSGGGKCYLILIIVLVVILVVLIAMGLVLRHQKSVNNLPTNQAGEKATASTTVPTTTELQMAQPGSGALSKADFSFGGRTVKGYQNFIDLCEKEGGSHNYYFDESSSFCRNANRGVDIGSDVLTSHNTVTDAFGEPNEQTEIGTLPDWVDEETQGYSITYKFNYHGRTYDKIFYVIVGAAWAGVDCIAYIVE